MEEEQQWYYLVGEEQLGPVSPEQLQELAAGGQIQPDTQLWTEGLEEWVQAVQVEGLFQAAEAPHPHLVVGAEAQAAHPFAGEVLAGQPAPTPAQAAPEAYLQPGQVSPPGTDYPTVGPLKASFGWLLTLPILAFLGLGGAILFIVLRANALSDGSSAAPVDLLSFAMEMLGVLISTTAFFVLCFVLFIILKMMILHRAWRVVQFGGARTTPGKAVGFLFIPFFKFYWFFVAYLGLAKDWNRIRDTHPNLAAGPRLGEALTMTYCIFTLVHKVVWWVVFFANIGNDEADPTVSLVLLGLFLLALLFELIFMAGVCRMVNFMGRLHYQQSHPNRGGLRFY